MTSLNIDYWLRKRPRPAVVLADDNRIEVQNNERGWKDLTTTVKSMEPSRLTALDKAGNVIRSVVLDAEDEKSSTTTLSKSERSDLQMLASLVSEAYEKSGKMHQPVLDSAMRFVETQSIRLLKAEAEIDRLRGLVHKLNLQLAEKEPPQLVAAEGEGGVVNALVSGFLSAQQNALVPPPPPNGKGNSHDR